MGETCGDYEGHGWLDLNVTNYLEWSAADELTCRDALGEPDCCSPQTYVSPARDVLYRNRGDGTSRDVAALSGCAVDGSGVSKAGMGVAVADVDGEIDLLVGNLNEQSDYFFLGRRGTFRDRTYAAGLGGVSRPFTRFGLGLFDFDRDGHFDLFAANGRVSRQGPPYSGDVYAEPNLLLRGLPGPRFEEVLPRGGTVLQLYATSRAAAFGDLASNDPHIHVGLGPHDRLDEIEVHWPSGLRERFGSRAAGSYHELREGEGERVAGAFGPGPGERRGSAAGGERALLGSR